MTELSFFRWLRRRANTLASPSQQLAGSLIKNARQIFRAVQSKASECKTSVSSVAEGYTTLPPKLRKAFMQLANEHAAESCVLPTFPHTRLRDCSETPVLKQITSAHHTGSDKTHYSAAVQHAYPGQTQSPLLPQLCGRPSPTRKGGA